MSVDITIRVPVNLGRQLEQYRGRLPEQVLALRPSDAMQDRVSELLRRSKTEGLSRTEESELDRYLYLEHLVRLAKARALDQISPGS